MGELPPKLFFRIGEVAGLVGVEPHVLRYWEREFRSIRPTKSAKGQRVYSRKDVENLLRVRDLLYRDGFTIAGAKKKLQRALEPTSLMATSEELAEETMLVGGAHAHSTAHRPHRAPLLHKKENDEHEHELEGVTNSHDHALKEESDHEPPGVRAKLVALRSEIEAFLTELSHTKGVKP